MKDSQAILVTGAAGYVGSFLAKKLIKLGYRIRLIDNYYIPSNITEIDYIPIEKVDIRDEIDISNYDIIVHCAAISGIGKCEHDKKEAQSVNVKGTYNLIKSCKGRFIFPSTSAIYGVCQEPIITEKHPPIPRNYYGQTKLNAEKIVELSEKYVILRFSNIYGNGLFCKRTVTDIFIESALRNMPLEIKGDGRQRRDFVHINDVIRAYLLAVKSEINGVYNIGGNQALSINEIAELVNKRYQKLNGIRLDVKYIPEDCGVIWKDFEYSSQKAKDFLRYEPLYSISDEVADRLNVNSRAVRSN